MQLEIKKQTKNINAKEKFNLAPTIKPHREKILMFFRQHTVSIHYCTESINLPGNVLKARPRNEKTGFLQ